MFASRQKTVSGHHPADSQQIASPHQKYQPISRGSLSNHANLPAGINTHPPHTPSHEAILQQSSYSNYGGSPPIKPGVAVVIPVSNKQYYQQPRSTPKAATNVQNVFLPTDSKPPTSTPVHDASLIPSVDYQMLLISLADEYFTAAYACGSVTALAQQEAEVHTYYKLVATGLGCLEAVLKHFRLQPLVEVKVRLRYAMVLYEETDNSIQAEEALSKGVAICEMHRFHDLKYHMQHLLAKVLYKRNPRASFKFVDGIIQDLEAYQYIPWVYAFRFLRLSFLLEFSSHQENLSALNHVRFLSSTAEKYGDKAVNAIAMTLESLIHLRESNSAESIEQAQRALAAARSSQLDPQVKNNPQLAILTSFVDLCCTLQTFDSNHAASKMQAMQTSLEDHPNASAWANDGSFEIPISHTKASPTTSSDGPLRQNMDGNLILSFKWLPVEDLHALGYLLSSIAIAYRNTSDGQRSEQLLREGMNFLDKFDNETPAIAQSVSTAYSRQNWKRLIKCHLKLQLVFELCIRTAWDFAAKELRQLKPLIAAMPISGSTTLALLAQYLEGLIYQGTGFTDIALTIFTQPSLSLPAQKIQSPTNPIHLVIALLSTLNSILIIRSPNHPSKNLLPSLLSSLELHIPHLTTCKPLQSAYHLVLATSLDPPPTIVKTKQYLQIALQAAKASSNNQLMCMTLNFMSSKFFKGVVGEQAEKSAKASDNLARKGMDSLWKTVSAGVLGDTLELAGKGKEAEEVRSQGREIAMGLPDGVQRWEANDNVRIETAMDGAKKKLQR